ncbi:MAG: glutathione S-transferase family protein [Burkholderiaceae bacterium]
MSPSHHPAQPIKLHTFALSGHCHRVQLFASLLNLPVTLHPVDLAKGAHKQADFLALNPFGQVPVIEDGDVALADSNAILVYLASRYDTSRQWLPGDPVLAAQVQRWLSAAAGPLAYGAAAVRVALLFKRNCNQEELLARTHTLLAVMEQSLQPGAFLVGGLPTLADVALYSYVFVAPEGNFSLAPFPNVLAWLARIEALPGFVPMPVTAIGLRG